MSVGFNRYARQILIKEIGIEGQKKLDDAKVMVIGAGGLGSPVLMYLAAAGVGMLGIIDGDVVSESNLNRQILYGPGDIGHSKAERAGERIRAINDLIEIKAHHAMLTDENASMFLNGYDIAIFCLDSIQSRKIANKACVKNKIPFVEAGISGFHGIMTTVIPGITPCYECIYGSAADTGLPTPVLGAIAGIVGSMQALAAIRLIVGLPEPSAANLVMIDGSYGCELIKIEKNPQCHVCGGFN